MKQFKEPNNSQPANREPLIVQPKPQNKSHGLGYRRQMIIKDITNDSHHHSSSNQLVTVGSYQNSAEHSSSKLQDPLTQLFYNPQQANAVATPQGSTGQTIKLLRQSASKSRETSNKKNMLIEPETAIQSQSRPRPDFTRRVD